VSDRTEVGSRGAHVGPGKAPMSFWIRLRAPRVRCALTRRDTRRAQNPPWHSALGSADVDQAVPRQKSSQKSLATPARAGLHGLQAAGWDRSSAKSRLSRGGHGARPSRVTGRLRIAGLCERVNAGFARRPTHSARWLG